MNVLKVVPKLIEIIDCGIPKAADRIKVADKKRIGKALGDARDFLGKARKDDYLGALEKALEQAESSVS